LTKQNKQQQHQQKKSPRKKNQLEETGAEIISFVPDQARSNLLNVILLSISISEFI